MAGPRGQGARFSCQLRCVHTNIADATEQLEHCRTRRPVAATQPSPAAAPPAAPAAEGGGDNTIKPAAAQLVAAGDAGREARVLASFERLVAKVSKGLNNSSTEVAL